MMWPPNDEAVGRVLERISHAGTRAGGTARSGARSAAGVDPRGVALYAEAVETRHQEVSDYPSLLHPILAFFAMAGPRSPHTTHRQQTAIAVGFLGLVGGLAADRASSELGSRCETASGLLVGEMPPTIPASRGQAPVAGGSVESKAGHPGGSETAGGRYVVHGTAAPEAWKEAEQRARSVARASRVLPSAAASVDGLAMVAVERADKGGLNELV